MGTMTKNGKEAAMAEKSVCISTGSAIRVGAMLALVCAFFVVLAVGPADAGAKKCFGKKVNRVISGDGGKVKLDFKDVAFVSGNNVTVIGKPFSVICGGEGRQVIKAGKGRSLSDGGPGDDKILLHDKSFKSEGRGGLGDDEIRGSRNHDFLYGGPKSVPKGASDDDTIDGLGGNDRIFDYGGDGNKLIGNTGSDHIYSIGKAVSDIYGGSGTDFLNCNGGKTDGGRLERVFGEQGNDRINCDEPNNNGGAFIDGGEGDDQMTGSPADDVLITHSGKKTIDAGGGNDLVVTTSKGLQKISGGAGTDTISYEAHTPADNVQFSGVRVNLQQGFSLGQTTYQLSGFENVIGSAFDDEIRGLPGSVVDGGLGNNTCSNFAKASRCNKESPGELSSRNPLVYINEGGILTVMGTPQGDKVDVGYDGNGYRVSAPGGVAFGLCEGSGGEFSCPADVNSLNGMLVYGNDGADDVSLQGSIPTTLSTTINGGDGANHIIGGPSKDFISTSIGKSAGSVIEGRDNLDVLYINDNVIARGGDGTDGIHVESPCAGGESSGGDGTDSTIFAGADKAVDADLAGGSARWANGDCANPLKIDSDTEKLEGSEWDDELTLGKRMKTQQGKSSLLGREGQNILNSKNGVRDTVTTGPAARANTVVADKQDKVIYGWGLASF
ncbi:MAG: hypothetical protein JJE13_10590 [Thermoleophilia bacterium]|nr:hypothetical protein [Thermoleophilia bacterium]